MILADKILCLRKKKGWSQEELANRLNVSRQSVSKWESDAAIPDMNKIVLLSQLFDVSTDYLLKEDLDDDLYESKKIESDVSSVHLNSEYVDEFLDVKRRNSKIISIGVSLILLGVIILILFTSGYEAVIGNWSTAKANVFAMITFFTLLVIAVVLFILAGMRISDYEYLEKKKVILDKKTYQRIWDLKLSFKQKYSLGIIFGVSFILIGVIPLIVAGLLDAKESTLVYLVTLLLAVIAISVYIFIRVGIVYGAYQILLNEGDYSIDKKYENIKYSEIAPFFWVFVTAIYLAWSFISHDWKSSWIVWPIAGVLYIAITKLIVYLKSDKK